MGTTADKLAYLQGAKEAIPGGHRESGGHSARWAPLPSIREPDP